MSVSAVGMSLARVRAMVRRAARARGVSSWPDAEREATGDRIAARLHAGDRLALACSEAQEVRRFLGTLAEGERALFAAYFFEERKLSAIARERGVSVRRLDGLLHDLADDFLAAMTDPATGTARRPPRRDGRTGRFKKRRIADRGLRIENQPPSQPPPVLRGEVRNPSPRHGEGAGWGRLQSAVDPPQSGAGNKGVDR